MRKTKFPYKMYISINNALILFLINILPVRPQASLHTKPVLENNRHKYTKNEPFAEVLRSYLISSPGLLCSAPNTDEFMFSIEGKGVSEGFYILKPQTSPLFIEYKNGTFKIELIVVLKSDTSKEYLIAINGSDKTFGNPNIGFTPAANYCASTDTADWLFYNQFTFTLTGLNANAGQIFTFESPQNNKHTIQLGKGANTWQNSLGSGLWFDDANTNSGAVTIKGDLQMALTPYEYCKSNICIPYFIKKKNTHVN